MDRHMPQTVAATVAIDDVSELTRALQDHLVSLLSSLRGYSLAEELDPLTVTVAGVQQQVTILVMITAQDAVLAVVLRWSTIEQTFYVVVSLTPDGDWVPRQEYYSLDTPVGDEEEDLQRLSWAPLLYPREEPDEAEDTQDLNAS